MTDSMSPPQPAVKLHPGKIVLKWAFGILFKVVLPAAIVLSAVGFYQHQMDTRPRAERRPPDRQSRLVTVETARLQTRAAVVNAMGTVRAATEITLTPEVSGIVVFMDPSVLPGGLVEAGEVLYRIDSRDNEAIVEQRQSEVARAELALRLEQGNQTVALQEYELLGDVIDEQDMELVLRTPHLEETRRALAAAKAALAKAMLDVERCTIRAPFNAVIKTKHADVGARVSPTAPLAVLTGTDEYWVETFVSVDQLRWIQVPKGERADGALVGITNPTVWGEGVFREGRVLRLMGQLEEAGRKAQLIVSVPDPLRLKNNGGLPPLLIGSYVRAEIEGLEIPDVVVLPRAYLRDGNYVWVMNDKDALEIRPVEIIFRGRETVYLSQGLADGERVVSSALSTPVEGMPLRLDGAKGNADPEAESNSGAQQ